MAKSGTHDHESGESLRRLLCDYLLTKGEGSMERLIDDLVFLHKTRGQDHVAVLQGQANIFRQRVHRLLTNWGITIDAGSVDAKGEDEYPITIPTFDKRLPDYPLIASHLYHEAANCYANSAERVTVRSISLLLLWFLQAYPHWSFGIRKADGYIRMKNFVKRTVAMTSSPCIGFVPGLRAGRPELKSSYGWLDDLIKKATKDSDTKSYMKDLMLLDLSRTYGSKLVQWYLNWDGTYTRATGLKLCVPQIPLDHICQAMSNIQRLAELKSVDHLPKDAREKVETCLRLRRKRFQDSTNISEIEAGVAAELGMNRAEYEVFTEVNHINILFSKPDNVFEKSEESRRRLIGSERRNTIKNQTSGIPSKRLLKIPEGSSWSDVMIRPSREAVDVKIPGGRWLWEAGAKELGFPTKRSGEPSNDWSHFLAALRIGYFPTCKKSADKKSENRLKRVVSRLRKYLCSSFGTDEDPFKRKNDKGWEFKARVLKENEPDYVERAPIEPDQISDSPVPYGKKKYTSRDKKN